MTGDGGPIATSHAVADTQLEDYLKMLQSLRPRGAEAFVLRWGWLQPIAAPDAHLVKRFHPWPRHCFHNAARLAEREGFVYCEGFAVGGRVDVVFHHAWCLNAEGHVIDPTWAAHSTVGLAYWGVPIRLASLKALGLKQCASALLHWPSGFSLLGIDSDYAAQAAGVLTDDSFPEDLPRAARARGARAVRKTR